VIAVTEKGDIAYSAILKGMPAIVMSVAHKIPLPSPLAPTQYPIAPR
jgi:hypothetical protein